MALDLYDQVFIEVQGQLLAENTSINTDLTSDDQDVMTTVKGWSGVQVAVSSRSPFSSLR